MPVKPIQALSARVLIALLFLQPTLALAQSANNATSSQLDNPLRHFYLEARAGVGGVRHSELDFYPSFGGFTAGGYVRRDIGIEVFADGELSLGEEAGFELGVRNAYGVALRLQSPPIDDVLAYVHVGYVDFQVFQDALDVDRASIVSDFTGLRFGVGMAQRLKRFRALQVTAEYRNFYSGADIQVDGVSLGLRASFR